MSKENYKMGTSQRLLLVLFLASSTMRMAHSSTIVQAPGGETRTAAFTSFRQCDTSCISTGSSRRRTRFGTPISFDDVHRCSFSLGGVVKREKNTVFDYQFHGSCFCRIPTKRFSSNENDENTTKSNFSLDGFNPFEQDQTTKRNMGGGVVTGGSSFGVGTSRNEISPRQTTMKEVVNQILNVVKDDNAIQEILQANRTFLMEPFDNLNGFLESDSIYEKTMTRQQRLMKFKFVMNDRIEQAKNGSAKTTLQAILDYVLEEASKTKEETS